MPRPRCTNLSGEDVIVYRECACMQDSSAADRVPRFPAPGPTALPVNPAQPFHPLSSSESEQELHDNYGSAVTSETGPSQTATGPSHVDIHFSPGYSISTAADTGRFCRRCFVLPGFSPSSAETMLGSTQSAQRAACDICPGLLEAVSDTPGSAGRGSLQNLPPRPRRPSTAGVRSVPGGRLRGTSQAGPVGEDEEVRVAVARMLQRIDAARTALGSVSAPIGHTGNW